MASSVTTAGGGAAFCGTAAPGSDNACDSCGATDELKEWSSDSGVVYYACKVCWFDLQDSADELRALQLDTAEHDGGCDDCGSPTAFTTEFWHNDGRTFHLCENCYQSADQSEDYMEPLPKRPELQCEDCQEKPSADMFVHLDGRTFNLCAGCHQNADHEDDYGASFGSVPILRKSGPAKLCECPLPCDFISPTHCELCKGIVVIRRDD